MGLKKEVDKFGKSTEKGVKKDYRKLKKFALGTGGFLVFLGVAIFLFLYIKTGFFSLDKIDEKDLAYWERGEDGIIVGQEEFFIEGDKETCWLMLHGYSSGPIDMKPLANRVGEEFGDYVFVPRLEGHGTVPSDLINLTLENWYSQIEEDFENLEIACESVNVVGFSFGGALAMRLSEEKKVKNTYLIAPYLYPVYNKIKIFDFATYLNLLAEPVVYSKKFKIAQINSNDFLEDYISYWSFVLLPVKKSGSFLNEVFLGCDKIKNNILIQHSKGDDTADVSASKKIFERVSTSEENKELVLFKRSNHILLYDYDREEVINNIINFEKVHR